MGYGPPQSAAKFASDPNPVLDKNNRPNLNTGDGETREAGDLEFNTMRL
jgi:hypothetical protein